MLSFPVRAFGWVLGEVPRAVVGWERVNAVLQATGAMEFGSVSLPPGTDALPSAARSVDYAYEVENLSLIHI